MGISKRQILIYFQYLEISFYRTIMLITYFAEEERTKSTTYGFICIDDAS